MAQTLRKQFFFHSFQVIVMLERDYSDETKLRFDNVNVQGAVFEGNPDNLDTLTSSCSFDYSMQEPEMASNPMCPKSRCRHQMSASATRFNPSVLSFVAIFLSLLMALLK